METNASFAWAARVVVLYSKSTEDLNRTIIHTNGYAEMIFPKRISQELSGTQVEIQDVSNPVKLRLRHFKGVKWSTLHDTSTIWLLYIPLSYDLGTVQSCVLGPPVGHGKSQDFFVDTLETVRSNSVWHLDLFSPLGEIG
jgi:hypothetical protein